MCGAKLGGLVGMGGLWVVWWLKWVGGLELGGRGGIWGLGGVVNPWVFKKKISGNILIFQSHLTCLVNYKYSSVNVMLRGKAFAR